MSSHILPLEFFNRPTLEIMPTLLGKYLVRNEGAVLREGMVTEIEAYIGTEDKACHAAKGKTERTQVMFEPAGTWYVYLCYGMYWMLNIVTEAKDFPAAILLRGLWQEGRHYDGPGKLTRYFEIDRSLNGKPATPASGLWFEDRGRSISAKAIQRAKRVGIAYAGKWQHKLWRYYIEV
ncbi:MAG: DNA-3-methyladenine glycosylase [Deltaproteobacteria bacterium]|nr:DNA-3-methyladenine glycosylase [Deltaproteobacteria bacterium]